MDTKSSWIILTLVLLAVTFVPLIPNDVPRECVGDDLSCENASAYISVYGKYIQ